MKPQVEKSLSLSATEEERISWLQLYRSENVGVRAFYALTQLCGSVDAALQQAGEISLRGGKKRPIKIAPRAEAEREMAAATRIGAHVIIRSDAAYPRLLAEIHDAPPVITVRGNVKSLSAETVAMVGARNASLAGLRLAESLAAELGREGFIVASGMARGIDTAAHRGSVASGTVAVLAGGIDNIYPPENARLYQEIAEKGAIVAELPYGAVPRAQHFPQRNRIIAGLARGTVVVEATLRSGSLITARLALEQGRDVFAVPGSPADPRSEGPNHLLKQGATLVTGVSDIVQALRSGFRSADTGLFEKEKDTQYGFGRFNPPAKEELERARGEIVSMLSSVPITIDALVQHSGFSASVIQIVLLELELAGRIEHLPGGRVALIA
ncbi:MAG: DNA-protecting protein DprA [Proteobacteria bacterium]|nr:DNA-protecting protein DprA [Pseudomonadota bacterium]